MTTLSKKISKLAQSHNFQGLFIKMLAIYSPALVILAIIRLQTRIPVRHLTKDTLVIVGEPFYFGLISNLGILLWCSCAAICILVAIAIPQSRENRKICSFLLFSGILTSVLLIDDLFLLHEEVFPRYLRIPENIVFLTYAIIIFLYLLKFMRVILKTEFFFLLLAFIFLGSSMFFDKNIISLPQSWLENEGLLLLEDGAKFLGILSWLTYFSQLCLSQLKKVIGRERIDIH